MPISVTCPECDATYRVADEAAGKPIKCKQCGARVSVPAADDDTGNDAVPPKKKGKGKLIGIIVGALLFLLTCCICTPLTGGGVWWFGFKDKANVLKVKGAGGGGVFLAAGTVLLDKKETLTLQDPKLKINSIRGAFVKPVRQYKVKLDAQNKYRIDMTVAANSPPGAEPFLVLLDPQGKEVGRNDNIGGFLTVRVEYIPAATGEFTIQASAFVAVPPSGMPFHLTVRTE